MATESLPNAIDLEFKRMAKYANKQRVSCWFVTYPGYRNAEFLKAPICLLFPDFVVGEFPNLYQKPTIEYHKKLFSVLIPKAKQFITISDHVKNKYLIGVFAAKPDRCRTIRHASPSLASYAPYLPAGMRKTLTSKRAAGDTIREYCTSHFDEWPTKGPITTGVVQPYLLGFPFEHVPYVLVATQNRPYKNTLGVIRAVQKLNQRGTPCKLIMTGDFGLDDPLSDIGRYVRRERLLLDVLCIPRVPREILAALFHCATVAVHASFYEGGVGAFPFFEGMSVGTPALLSRNQATLELNAGEDIDEFLFEPSNVDEISEKIKAILKAPECAFKRQRPIYNSLNRRTWEEASREYVAAFRETAQETRGTRGWRQR
jgi:glycosyltransferase involved in cell wall biosynthesis